MNPAVTHDMSVLALLANASLLVQLVMALLLLASLFSWYYIFLKLFILRRATRLANDFEKEFWSGATRTGLVARTTRPPAVSSASSRRASASSRSCASSPALTWRS